MNEENRQKMITAMKMMKEACNNNTAWANCRNCPFDSFCTALMRAGIELYNEETYDDFIPSNWEPDDIKEVEEDD